jgi:lysozyme
MSDPRVARAQERLRELGYGVGKVDGVRGPLFDNGAALYALDTLGEVEPAPREDPLISELRRDEGTVLHAYRDSLGFITIGTGRLIDKRRGGGISQAEADYLLRNDVAGKRAALDAKIPWWRGLDPVRQRAVQNMAFQLGTGDMGGATFNLIRNGHYAEAAKRLRGWKWAKQTPARAGRVIAMIETGKA